MLLCHDRRMRIEEHLVPGELFRRRMIDIDKIDRRMAVLRGVKERLLARPVNAAMPYIQLRIPDVVIILEDGNLRFEGRAGNRRHLLDHFVHLANLADAAVLTAGIIQNAVPVDLGAHRTGAPAEVADVVRAMRDGLHGPQRQLARARCRRFHAGVPAVGAALLLHDAKPRGSGAGFGQVAAPLAVLQIVRPVHILAKAVSEVRIAVVGQEIEALAGHGMVVQVAEQAVGGNEIARLDILAQDVGLQLGKAARAA